MAEYSTIKNKFRTYQKNIRFSNIKRRFTYIGNLWSSHNSQTSTDRVFQVYKRARKYAKYLKLNSENNLNILLFL